MTKITDNVSQDPLLNFHTLAVATVTCMGNGTDGHVEFYFMTPPGTPNFRTRLNPNVTAQTAASLNSALQSVPSYDFGKIDTPGENDSPQNPVRFFDQEYDASVLEAMGLLMVRANLLEHGLINLFSSLTGMAFEQAFGILHSTLNLANKIGMIKAALDASGIEKDRQKIVEKALDRAKKVSDRRNHLVHAQWTFDGPNIRAATRKKDEVVTAHFLHTLASDYRNASIALEVAANDSINVKKMREHRKNLNQNLNLNQKPD